MSEKRIGILDALAQGQLTVSEALALIQVLVQIEALDFSCVELAQQLSIDVYLE